MADLLPLDAWARARYGEHAPSAKTLRRWVREAKIVPVPKKHGRAYFVMASARYIDFKDPNYPKAVAKAINESTETQ